MNELLPCRSARNEQSLQKFEIDELNMKRFMQSSIRIIRVSNTKPVFWRYIDRSLGKYPHINVSSI